MARFTFNTTLTLAHHAAHVDPIVDRALHKHYGVTSDLLGTWATWITVSVASALCLYRGWDIFHYWWHYGGLYIWPGDWALLVVWGLLVVPMLQGKGQPNKLIKKSVNKLVSFDGVNVGPMSVVADDDSLTVEHTKRKTTYKWAAFEAVGETGEALALRMSKVMVVLLPFSAFKDEAKRAAFEAFARAKIEA